MTCAVVSLSGFSNRYANRSVSYTVRRASPIRPAGRIRPVKKSVVQPAPFSAASRNASSFVPADSSSSGSVYYKSDQLRLIDALRIMMSESSNTMANLVARVCGKMLLDRSGRQTCPGD